MFSQDDFIFLYWSHANNLKDFLSFFNPFIHPKDIFFYRPLSTQVYFWINQTVFGLNPLPFQIEAFLFHFLNSFLFYLVTLKLWGNKNVAILSGFLYAISAIHFLSLFYIASFQEILRVTFILASILAFFKYFDTKKILFLILGLLSFVGALLSKENSLIFPLVIFPLEIIRQRNYARKVRPCKANILAVFFLSAITLLYLFLRTRGIQSIFGEGDYHITTNPFDWLQNLKWYLIWTFGLPEILDTYPSLKPDSILQFLKDFKLAPIIGLSLLFFIGTIIASLDKIKIQKRIILASIAVYLLFLLPVLPLFGHKYPQYLDLPYLVILPPLCFIFIKKHLGKVALFAFVILQISSLVLTYQTHWATQRPKVADYYYKVLTQNYPKLDPTTTVIFKGTEPQIQELSVVLAKDYAVRDWYACSTNRVIYQLNSDTTNYPNSIVIPIIKY